MALNHSPSIVTNGLVLYLDAANRRSYPGSGTSWFDLSGNNNHGALTNGPTFSSANGGGIVFDGGNDYINISPSGYNLGVNFTLQLWTRITRFGGFLGSVWNRAALVSNSYPYTSNMGFLFMATSQDPANGNIYAQGKENLFLSMGQDQYGAGAIIGSLTPYVDKWVNLSAVVNGTNRIRLYINAVEPTYAYQDNGPSSISYTGGPFSIGTRNNTEEFLQGSISNVSIYNRALTSLEIAQNYNATKGRFGL